MTIGKKKRPQNEYCVALVVQSKKLTAEDISRTLKIRPTRAHEKGEQRKVLGRWAKFTKSYWCLEMGRTSSISLDKQIAHLLKRFQKHEKQLALLSSKGCEITVYCGGFPRLATQTFHLNPGLLGAISKIDAGFELVTYGYIYN